MIRTTIILLLSIVILISFGGNWLWHEKERQIHSPLQLGQTTRFSVKQGSHLGQVLQQLREKQLIKNTSWLEFEARYRKIAQNIKAGEYEISPGTTQIELLSQFINGKVIQYSVTIIEGWTFRQMLEAIWQNEEIANTLIKKSDPEIMAAIGHPDQHPEGMFYPDTYHFPANTNDIDFLKRAYNRLQEVLADEWQQRSDKLPYQSDYEALIMASIIEKETGQAEERQQIAGVFVRRLEKNMKLQTDPTVIYALGSSFDGNIRRKDLKYDSPYNTYVYKGLPPTPIALAGRAAIHAALHPSEGDALYFVSRGDGSHYFSASLKEHNQAVRKYQLKK